MVIHVFSIYKSVLETDIVKQKIASQEKGNFSNDDGTVSSNVSSCRDYFNSRKKPHVGGFSLPLFNLLHPFP